MNPPEQPEIVDGTAGLFHNLWPRVTDDSNVTLHGFRRFKTTHLLNLRFLEEEIAELDHTIYQAGLGLGHEPSARDRLGLRHSKVDSDPSPSKDVITRELVLRLRSLIPQYDEALAAFNHVMAMETVSLLDDEKQSQLISGLTLYEKYKTRLLRVDLGSRARADPLQRWVQRTLRYFRYWRIARRQEGPESSLEFPAGYWSYNNTVLVASIAGRVLSTIVVGLFLVVPLTLLSVWPIKGNQIAVVCVFITFFSVVVAVLLKVSSYEMLAASAAYAAVLSVFVSNGS